MIRSFPFIFNILIFGIFISTNAFAQTNPPPDPVFLDSAYEGLKALEANSRAIIKDLKEDLNDPTQNVTDYADPALRSLSDVLSQQIALMSEAVDEFIDYHELHHPESPYDYQANLDHADNECIGMAGVLWNSKSYARTDLGNVLPYRLCVRLELLQGYQSEWNSASEERTREIIESVGAYYVDNMETDGAVEATLNGSGGFSAGVSVTSFEPDGEFQAALTVGSRMGGKIHLTRYPWSSVHGPWGVGVEAGFNWYDWGNDTLNGESPRHGDSWVLGGMSFSNSESPHHTRVLAGLGFLKRGVHSSLLLLDGEGGGEKFKLASLDPSWGLGVSTDSYYRRWRWTNVLHLGTEQYFHTKVTWNISDHVGIWTDFRLVGNNNGQFLALMPDSEGVTDSRAAEISLQNAELLKNAQDDAYGPRLNFGATIGGVR